jgi:galactose oxidase-like protein
MRFKILLAVSLSFALAESSSEAIQATSGTWAPGYNHPANSITGWPSRFEAINLAVIPLVGTGASSNPGLVIVWDNNSGNMAKNGSWDQRFAVGSPESGVFNNFVIPMPITFGDMFCSGHVWMPDGRLFVAGGTTKYPGFVGDYFIGSKFVGIWDPALVNNSPFFGWTFVCDPSFENKPLGVARWYPTVTLLGDNQIMVAGGVVDTDNTQHNICGTPSSFDTAIDTYEIWDIAANDWVRDPVTGSNILFNGPEHAPTYFGSCFSMFGEYPRQHLISDGSLFVAGMNSGSNHAYAPTDPINYHWAQDPPPLTNRIDTGGFRSYGASILVPNVGNRPNGMDKVWILGGSDTTNAMNTVKTINGFSGTAWESAPSMNVARMVANTVLLPDGAILEVGGCTGADYFEVTNDNNPNTNPIPEKRPEIYLKSVNTWVFQNAQSSERMYHSTAALLPSGNVVSAGGDIRTWDWEVFTPDYLAGGQVRPAFAVAPPTTLSFDTTYSIQYTPMAPGLQVERVVLMRPCSITHHSDMDQRYVELVEATTLPPPNTIIVKTPSWNPTSTSQGAVVAPPGWYMMFLISNVGTPSVAAWVQLQ